LPAIYHTFLLKAPLSIPNSPAHVLHEDKQFLISQFQQAKRANFPPIGLGVAEVAEGDLDEA